MGRKSRRVTMREPEIASKVIKWVNAVTSPEEEVKIYKEVRVGSTGPRADIVIERDYKDEGWTGITGTQLTVIEVKTQLTWRLIDQACFWNDFSHEVFIAIPKLPEHMSESKGAFISFMETNGIGIILMDSVSPRQILSPKLTYNPPQIARLRRRLTGEIIDYDAIAGSKNDYLSYIDDLILAVIKLLATNSGKWMYLTEIVALIEHKYKDDLSATAALSRVARRLKKEGIEMKKLGRKRMLRVKKNVRSWRL